MRVDGEKREERGERKNNSLRAHKCRRFWLARTLRASSWGKAGAAATVTISLAPPRSRLRWPEASAPVPSRGTKNVKSRRQTRELQKKTVPMCRNRTPARPPTRSHGCPICVFHRRYALLLQKSSHCQAVAIRGQEAEYWFAKRELDGGMDGWMA